jgi:hypothetical protein
MGTALSIAAVVVFYAAIFVLFAAGSIGLVGAAIQTGERRGWPSWRRGALAVAAVAAALLGGGLVFAFFWPFRQLRTTRPTGARRRLLQAAAALSLLLPSGCAAGSAVAGPCFFDPPPGDQLTLTIANGTPAAVTVVDCVDDDACSDALNPTPVAAGGRGSMPLEGCQAGTMGVLATGTGLLQSCIAEPTEDGDGNLRAVAVSEGRLCPHGRTGARVHIADPGG